MPYRLRQLNPTTAPSFAGMTFPAYRSKLEKAGKDGILAIGALTKEGEPVGLILIEHGRGRATLLSVLINLQHRLQGLGTALLETAEDLLAKVGIRTFSTSWSESLPGAPAMAALLHKAQYSTPSPKLLMVKGDWKGPIGEVLRTEYPRYQNDGGLPKGYELTPWRDMSRTDAQFILSRQGRSGWYEPRANPMRESRHIEPVNSLLLRHEGNIVGWLGTHRTSSETVRYTDVFVHENLRRSGAIAIAMVVRGFWLQHDHGPRYFTMGLEHGNTPLVAMCRRRMAKATEQRWSLESSKELITDREDRPV
ncbi:GNAT family N-acetyltransferase [Desulfovibrio ferrophilus]|uniref:Putative GCN5-related N-acetyltransferase n=1 Tax=Desulfovibrio ferrophilus TaxID=241368 RepID=A0A2Z6AY83_9BACT|nr:GNAT family N-acetyltransferase [Desulfovibrio ferrophilus]BBD08232.1 putative GCN5-related N-acetyltransferase [Desulfovibrio ferrophilus]